MLHTPAPSSFTSLRPKMSRETRVPLHLYRSVAVHAFAGVARCPSRLRNSCLSNPYEEEIWLSPL